MMLLKITFENLLHFCLLTIAPALKSVLNHRDLFLEILGSTQLRYQSVTVIKP